MIGDIGIRGPLDLKWIRPNTINFWAPILTKAVINKNMKYFY